MTRSRLWWWSSLWLLLAPAAAEVGVHGFIAQGAIYTDDNAFVTDDNGWSAANTEIGANLVWQADPRWFVAGQLIYLNGGNRYPDGTRVDYLLVDYLLFNSGDGDLHLQLGRFKNEHGLYRASRDVPATQPSIVLPQSVYWDMYRDQTLNTDGISGNGYRRLDWGYLDWQLSAGRTDALSDSMPQTAWVLGEGAKGDYHEKWVVQGSLFLTSPAHDLTGGVSLLRSHLEFDADPGSLVSSGSAMVWEGIASLRYSSGPLELTAEYIYDDFKLSGLYFPEFGAVAKSDGYYLQGRYWLNERLALLARYDHRNLDRNDRDGADFAAATGLPAWLRYSHDWMVGVSYELSPDWLVRAEWHAVEGAAWLPPHLFPDPQLHDQKYWNLVALQLSWQF